MNMTKPKCNCGEEAVWSFDLLTRKVFRCEDHKKEVESPVYAQQRIPLEGITIQLSDFYNLIDEYRYAGKPNPSLKELQDEIGICKTCKNFAKITLEERLKQLPDFKKHFQHRHPTNYASYVRKNPNGTKDSFIDDHPEEFCNVFDTERKGIKSIPQIYLGEDNQTMNSDDYIRFLAFQIYNTNPYGTDLDKQPEETIIKFWVDACKEKNLTEIQAFKLIDVLDITAERKLDFFERFAGVKSEYTKYIKGLLRIAKVEESCPECMQFHKKRFELPQEEAMAQMTEHFRIRHPEELKLVNKITHENNLEEKYPEEVRYVIAEYINNCSKCSDIFSDENIPDQKVTEQIRKHIANDHPEVTAKVNPNDFLVQPKFVDGKVMRVLKTTTVSDEKNEAIEAEKILYGKEKYVKEIDNLKLPISEKYTEPTFQRMILRNYIYELGYYHSDKVTGKGNEKFMDSHFYGKIVSEIATLNKNNNPKSGDEFYLKLRKETKKMKKVTIRISKLQGVSRDAYQHLLLDLGQDEKITKFAIEVDKNVIRSYAFTEDEVQLLEKMIKFRVRAHNNKINRIHNIVELVRKAMNENQEAMFKEMSELEYDASSRFMDDNERKHRLAELVRRFVPELKDFTDEEVSIAIAHGKNDITNTMAKNIVDNLYGFSTTLTSKDTEDGKLTSEIMDKKLEELTINEITSYSGRALESFGDERIESLTEAIGKEMKKIAQRIAHNHPELSQKFGEYKKKSKQEQFKSAVSPPIKHRMEKVPVNEFRDFIRDKNIFTQSDFDNYKKEHELPDGIPDRPEFYRKDGWTGWKDNSGKKRRKTLTRERMIEIGLKLQEKWGTYQRLPDGLLLKLFKSWGVFSSNDPMFKLLFSNFTNYRLKEKTSTALRGWIIELATGKPLSPEINGVKLLGDKTEESKYDFLERHFTITEKDVEEQTELFRTSGDSVIKIFNESAGFLPDEPEDDPELFELLKNFVVSEIWRAYFDNPHQKLHEPKNGDSLHDAIVDQFRKELDKVRSLDYKKYSYKFSKGKPTVLQLYGVYKASQKIGFLNMYGTGSGKTLVAIILAKYLSAKKVLWICPKGVITQTDEMIRNAYPDSITSSVLDDPKNWHIPDAFFKNTSKHVSQFHILNYDKFNNVRNYEKMLSQIKDAKVDLIIFDEAQRLKNRNEELNDLDREENATNTRKHVLNMIKYLRETNDKCKILMLSATPVVNTIREAMSLYELITGTKIDPEENSGRDTVDNGISMYCEFLPYSVRYEPKYDIDVLQKPILCEGFVPDTMSQETGMKMSFLEWESFFTSIRIPYMLKTAKKIIEKDPKAKIMIYTDWRRGGIQDQLETAFRDAGFKVGLYTGDDKSGMEIDMGKVGGHRKYYNPFVEGDINVLIATRAVAVGKDGIQTVCNHVFFNGLVWTWTDFEQIRGRLVRTGSMFSKVFVHLFLARVNEVDFDYEVKFLRIMRKKALGDCIRDGRLPKEFKMPKQKELKLDYIKKMFENRLSGFPTKEKIQEEQAEEAKQAIEEEVDKMNQDINRMRGDKKVE